MHTGPCTLKPSFGAIIIQVHGVAAQLPIDRCYECTDGSIGPSATDTTPLDIAYQPAPQSSPSDHIFRGLLVCLVAVTECQTLALQPTVHLTSSLVSLSLQLAGLCPLQEKQQLSMTISPVSGVVFPFLQGSIS